MPKLPEIRYSTNVQSLGREDVGAPGRLAAARIGAAQSIFEGVKEVERSFAAAEYTKQMSQARNSINELYDAVVSKEAFTSSEIPEFVTGIDRHETVTQPDGTEIVQERIIPASEVREAWFKQGMQNITNGVLKGTKTPTARTRISNELKTSIGPAAYNQLLTYNRAAVKKEQLAILDASVQDAVINGDRLAVEETLYRFLVSGLISKDDYETRKLTASQDLDIEAYTGTIFEAEDLSELEEIESQLDVNLSLTSAGEVNSDMTPMQRRSLRQSVSAQRAAFERERKEVYTENEQRGVTLALQGRLTDSWLIDMATNDGLEGSALRALDNMRNESSSTNVVRSQVVSDQKRAIQKALYHPEFGDQVSNLVQEIKSNLVRNESLNGAEVEQLMTYANTVEKQIRDNPEYKTALVVMRSVTGLPEDENALRSLQRSKMRRTPTEILAMKAYADFKTSLFNYIDEFGAEANVLEFVERNKDRYDYVTDPKKVRTVEDNILNSPYKGYAIGPLPFDSDVVMKNAYKDFQSGKRTDEEMFDLWNIIYGDAVDLPFLEEL